MSRPRSPTLVKEPNEPPKTCGFSQKCTGCKKTKKIEYFSYKDRSKQKMDRQCKECKKDSKRKYYKANLTKFRERSRKYYEENKEKILAKRKRVGELTPEQKEKRRKASRLYSSSKKSKAKRNATAREKYRNDPEIRLRRSITGILGHFVRGINTRGSKFVGCTLSQYKAYVESKFKPGMTWENRGQGKGKWSLGHDVTFVSFRGELNVYIKPLCWWGNCVPIWDTENQKRCRIKASEEDKQDLLRRYLAWVATGRESPMIKNY